MGLHVENLILKRDLLEVNQSIVSLVLVELIQSMLSTFENYFKSVNTKNIVIMNNFKRAKVGRATSILLSVTTTLWLSGAAMLVPVVTHADALSDLQAQIASLLSQIATLQSQLTTLSGGTTATTACSFDRSLMDGVSGSDVTCLQDYLTGTGHFTFSGGSTGYYGPITTASVAAWQAANGVAPAVGYFGPISQAKYTSIAGTVVVGDDGVVIAPLPTGTGLSVVAASQPSATLAPNSATRIPFTNFTLTAGASDVVINGLTVERTGLASDAVFAGVILLDENGTQIGISKTLNSNHQTVIGGTFTVLAGTSKVYTLAGNMASDLTSYAGQIAYIALVGVNTSDTVAGSLPITGVGHTINSSLSLGTVTLARGAVDPATSPTKAVGTTDYVFTSIKITAAVEDVLLEQVRFNQSGSVTTGDLANIKIYLDGVAYDPILSTDGKYYTAIFGDGITIAKGLNKSVYIKGDIVSGSGRTIDFDLWKYEDVVAKGKTYGYYITPTATNEGGSDSDDSQFYGTNPRYDASQVAVGNGSLVISSSNVVTAGNIANGGTDVSLGSLLFDVTGEPISFSGITFKVATSGQTGVITNVTLVNENGAVLAGPQDVSVSAGTVALSDTVTLPVGKNILIIKGNLDSNWTTNQTIRFRLDTPETALTTPLGQTTGQSITPTPNSPTYANTQTVSAGDLTVSPAASFAAQNIINNGTGITLAEFVLDASASGEDLRISTIQIRAKQGADADIDDINSIQLFDGATPLNTGGNVLNPSGNDDGDQVTLVFTLDAGALTIAKGTSKIITLKGNINDSTIGTVATHAFDFAVGSPEWSVTGISTGQDIGEVLTTTAGATTTVVAAGTLTLTLDSSSPTEKWHPAGSTLVEIATYRLTGTNEPMILTDFALTLASDATNVDFKKIYLYDGTAEIISKISPFSSGTTETFTGTLLNSFIVPINGYKKLTIKVDLADVGTGFTGVSGHLMKFSTTTTASNYKARGSESGTSVNILGSVGTITNGTRYYKSVPTISKKTTTVALVNGENTFFHFGVTADSAGDVGLYKFNFTVATTTAVVTSYVLTEVGGNIVANESNGITVSTDGATLDIIVDSTPYGLSEVTIPAGQEKTFKLTAQVTGSIAGSSISTTLNGDASYPAWSDMTPTPFTASTTPTLLEGENDFIWSDVSATSHGINTEDWLNGYKVDGFSAISSQVLSK